MMLLRFWIQIIKITFHNNKDGGIVISVHSQSHQKNIKKKSNKFPKAKGNKNMITSKRY